MRAAHALAALALAATLSANGCIDTSAVDKALFVGNCNSDDVCPVGQICDSLLFIGPTCEAPNGTKVCASSSECDAYQACRARDPALFSTSPGVTRLTCESKLCSSNYDCGPSGECAFGLFGPDSCVPNRTPDAGADAGLPLLAISDGFETSPDMSCKGLPPADAGPPSDAAWDAADDATPPLGELSSVPIEVQFGRSHDPLPGAIVDFYYGNAIAGHAPDVAKVTADDVGHAAVLLPAGDLVAYKVHSVVRGASIVARHPYFQFDVAVPRVMGPSRLSLTGITEDEFLQLLSEATGRTDFVLPSGTGVVAAHVVDCRGRDMINATVDIVDVDSGAPIPLLCAEKGTCRTAGSGLVVLIGVPSTEGRPLRVIAKGLYGIDAAPGVVGQRDLEVFEGGVSAREIGPD